MHSSLAGRKDATARSARTAKGMQAKQAQLDALVTWLVDRGVGKRNARRFLIKCAAIASSCSCQWPQRIH